MSRPTAVTIDLNAIAHNLQVLSDIASPSKVVGVVKADAYGNGVIEVARKIADGVSMLAVAFLSEAQELREYGITKPILVLQGPHSQQDIIDGAELNLTWMVHTHWQLKAFEQLQQDNFYNASKACKLWLKFDSGMHRLGFALNELSDILNNYEALVNQHTVLTTHLARADERDKSNAHEQFSAFISIANKHNLSLSIANSATNIDYPEARQSYVRLGIAMYGANPFEFKRQDLSLKAVNILESQIIALREVASGESVGYGGTFTAQTNTKIATVAIGYADGYPRHAANGTPAWCNGKLIYLAGRVSMDMLTFDVSHLDEVNIGDTVQLWGDKLPINKVADAIGTISYELMTRLSKRVPRHYLGN